MFCRRFALHVLPQLNHARLYVAIVDLMHINLLRALNDDLVGNLAQQSGDALIRPVELDDIQVNRIVSDQFLEQIPRPDIPDSKSKSFELEKGYPAARSVFARDLRLQDVHKALEESTEISGCLWLLPCLQCQHMIREDDECD